MRLEPHSEGRLFTQAGSQAYRSKECNKKYSERTVCATPRKSAVPTLDEQKSKHPNGLLTCRHCGSGNVRLKEYRGSSRRYLCRDCRKTMTLHVE